MSGAAASAAAASASLGLHTQGSVGLAIVFFAVLAGAGLFLLSADGRLMARRWPRTQRGARAARAPSAERLNLDLATTASSPARRDDGMPPPDSRDMSREAGDPVFATRGRDQPQAIRSVEPLPERVDLDPRCRMDLAATSSGLELTVELPGLEAKDVDIEVADDLLTIRGELRLDADREGKNYRLAERSYGVFERCVELPAGVLSDRIMASLDLGVLTVSIPNPCKLPPRRIEVQARPAHLAETEDGLALVVELPGLGEGDIDVVVSDRRLSVRTGCTHEAEGSEGPRDCAQPDGCLSRSIVLPDGVNADRISAALCNGVLTVMIPHAATPDARKIRVQAAT